MTTIQSNLCAALARHFRVKKSVFFSQAKDYLEQNHNGEHPIVPFKIEGTDHILRTACTKKSMPFSKMIFFKNIRKDLFYEDVVNLLNVTDADYVDFLGFYSGTELMVMHKNRGYDGQGGLYVYDELDREGYVIEPIKHYLFEHFPVDVE